MKDIQDIPKTILYSAYIEISARMILTIIMAGLAGWFSKLSKYLMTGTDWLTWANSTGDPSITQIIGMTLIEERKKKYGENID